MRIVVFLSLLTFAGCSAAQKTPESFEATTFGTDAAAAQKLMCVEENVGITRHDRGYLDTFCNDIKHQLELVCFRFVRNTKEYRKACVGIDTPDKLECISSIQNGTGYAVQASLEKCRSVANRKQVLCISKRVAKSVIALEPETVQECLDKNL